MIFYSIPLSGSGLSSCYTIPHLCRLLSGVRSTLLYLLFFGSVRPQQDPCPWKLSVRVHLRVRRRRSSQSAVQRVTQTCLLNTGRSRNWSSTSRYGNVTLHTTVSFLSWISTQNSDLYRELYYRRLIRPQLTGNNKVHALFLSSVQEFWCSPESVFKFLKLLQNCNAWKIILSHGGTGEFRIASVMKGHFPIK